VPTSVRQHSPETLSSPTAASAAVTSLPLTPPSPRRRLPGPPHPRPALPAQRLPLPTPFRRWRAPTLPRRRHSLPPCLRHRRRRGHRHLRCGCLRRLCRRLPLSRCQHAQRSSRQEPLHLRRPNRLQRRVQPAPAPASLQPRATPPRRRFLRGAALILWQIRAQASFQSNAPCGLRHATSNASATTAVSAARPVPTGAPAGPTPPASESPARSAFAYVAASAGVTDTATSPPPIIMDSSESASPTPVHAPPSPASTPRLPSPAPSEMQAPALISLSATNAPPAATATRPPPALVGLPLSRRLPTASVCPITGATTTQGSLPLHIALSLPTESAGPATSSPVPPSRVPASSPLVATIPAMIRWMDTRPRPSPATPANHIASAGAANHQAWTPPLPGGEQRP